MAGPGDGVLARYLRELEARARQGKPRTARYSRAAVIQDLALKPQTVSDWFNKGRVPEDFRQLWAFAQALLSMAVGVPPMDTAKGRAWWEGERARCRGLWQASRDVALAAAAESASSNRQDPTKPSWSTARAAVASVPFEAAVRDPEPVLADVLEHGFHGRRWLIEQINVFLRQQRCGFVWIEAEAGLGKTAIAAYLVREHGWISHFARLSQGTSVRAGLLNLAGQLVERFGLDELAPARMLPERFSTPAGFQDLLGHAAARARAAREKLVLVVDGADEAESPEGMLPWGLPQLLPTGVFVIGTYRTGFPPGRCQSKQTVLPIDTRGADNQADVALFLDAAVRTGVLAERLAESRVPARAFTRQLAERCDGVWLYLRYVLDEVRYGLRHPGDLSDLPDDLASFYTAHLVEWRKGAEWSNGLPELLATLAVAREPLTASALARLTHVDEEQVSRWCDYLLRPFLSATAGEWRRFDVFHASLREFLTGGWGSSGEGIPDEQRAWTLALRRDATLAHSSIADYYLRLFGGLESGLPTLAPEMSKARADDGYPLRHLAEHLVRAGRVDDLHDLLSVEHDSGVGRVFNVWFAAHDSAGTLDDYLDSVAVARHDYEVRTDQALALGHLAATLGGELRYALITASVTSLTDNLPIPLLTRLLATDAWGPDRVLAHARRITTPPDRAEALASIAPHLASALRSQALDYALSAITAITDDSVAADTLAAVGPHLYPHQLDLALNAAIAITREPYRARALAGLASRLLPDHLESALEAAASLDDEDARAEALAGLAPHLSPDQLTMALAAAEGMFWELPRAQAIAVLAPYLNSGQLTRALHAATAIPLPDYCAQALTGLAPHLPPRRRSVILSQALKTACSIDAGFTRAEALARLAPHLAPGQLTQAIKAAASIPISDARTEALASLAPYLTPGQLRDALADAFADYDLEYLNGLFRHLPREQRLTVLAETLGAAADMIQEWNWGNAKVMVALGPHLSPAELAQLLDAACTIQAQHVRSWVLTSLAPHLAPGQLTKALDASATIADHEARAKAIAGLAPHLTPGQLTKALDAAATIADDYAYATVLTGLAPCLPASKRFAVRARARTAARSIIDLGKRATALTGLVGQVGAGLRSVLVSEALAASVEGIRWEECAHSLAELAAYLSPVQLFRARAAVARMGGLSDDQAEAMAALTLRVPDEHIAQDLDAAIKDSYRAGRADILIAIAPRLSSFQIEQALAAAFTIHGPDEQNEVLAALAPFLSPTQLTQVHATAISTFDPEQLAHALATIAPLLPTDQRPPVLTQALDAALSIYRDDNRAHALSRVIPQLSGSQRADAIEEAVDAASQIEYEVELAAVLRDLAPSLSPSQLMQALKSATALTIELHRAEALAGLAPSLSPGQLGQALHAATLLTEEDQRTSALTGLAPYLAWDQLPPAIRAAPRADSKALSALMARAADFITLDSGLGYVAMMRAGLQAAPRGTSFRVVASSIPTLKLLAGPDALIHIADAIEDTRRWWP